MGTIDDAGHFSHRSFCLHTPLAVSSPLHILPTESPEKDFVRGAAEGDLTIRYGTMGFDLTAITTMIQILIDENPTPVIPATLDRVKGLYQ
jgi:hypothetical protein